MRARAILLPLLAAILAGGARADDLEKRLRDSDSKIRAEAVREIREAPSLRGLRFVFPLLDDEDTYVRDLTWATLAAVRDPEWIRWISGAMRTDRRERVRREAADALGYGKVAAGVPALVSLLGDRDRSVRAAAADALARFSGSDEAAAGLRPLAADREPAVRAAILEAIGRVDPKGAVPFLGAALRNGSEDEGVRCVALRSLRYAHRELAIEAGAWALLEGGWRLRAQAIENALWLRDRRVVEGLVAAAGRVQRARVRADLLDALRTLTGLEIPPTAADWQAWWKEHGAEWREGGVIPMEAKADPASSTARYYGIPVRSDRVCFLLDGSGSMRELLAADDARVKMDVAREELLRVLARLDDGVRFNVIVFADEPKAFRPSLEPLDAASRKKVETFVRPLAGGGRTNLHDALALALEDDDVDTVFLLSDGAPSCGEYQFPGRVLDHVRRLNRRRKIVVHTIAFGGRRADRELLENLASWNAGTAVAGTGR